MAPAGSFPYRELGHPILMLAVCAVFQVCGLSTGRIFGAQACHDLPGDPTSSPLDSITSYLIFGSDTVAAAQQRRCGEAPVNATYVWGAELQTAT